MRKRVPGTLLNTLPLAALFALACALLAPAAPRVTLVAGETKESKVVVQEK